jgi:hypothetical protein
MKTVTIQNVIASLRYKLVVSPTPDEVSRRQRFLEKFPNQEINILSFQDNPTCKCSHNLFLAVQNSSEDKDTLLSYIVGEPVHVISPVNMSGKVIIINDSADAWAELVIRFKTEMMMFKNLTIVPSINSVGENILRIFFY